VSAEMWAALPLLCAGAWLLSTGATAELTVNAIGRREKVGRRAPRAPEGEQGRASLGGHASCVIRGTGWQVPRVLLAQI
jgi:hypothetical protein